MLSRARLALIVCLLASFFQLYEAFQLNHWSGRHTKKRDLSKLAARKQQGGFGQGDQDSDNHGHCPSGHNRPNIIEILERHHPEEFCSRFLHIIPYVTTTETSTTTDDVTSTDTAYATTTSTQTDFATETDTTTSTQASTTTDSFTTTSTASTTDTSTTTTDTTTTATISSGTVTTSTTDSTTTTTTTTDATVISTFTDTTTSTSTTMEMRRAKRWDDIPPWLPFPRRQISSACVHFVHPRTDVISETATTTASFTTTLTDTTTATATTTDTDTTTTASTTTTTTGTTDATTSTTTTGTDSTTTTVTSTSTTTSTVPQTTTTATDSTTSTITSFVTESTSTTTTTAITTTETLPAAICVASCPTNIYGGINEIDSSNYLECIFLSGDYCLFTPSRQLVFDTGSSCPQTSPSSCTSCSYTCPGKDTTGSSLAAYYYNYNGSGNDMICIFNNDAECLYNPISGVLVSSNLDSNTCPSVVSSQC